MRIKGAVYSRHRKKKVFKVAKSYYSDLGRRWRLVKQQVDRSMRFATIHRKNKKREFRALWIARINAGARLSGLSYSRFMAALKKNNVALNRKSLAHLAANDPKSFSELVTLAKTSA